MALKYSVTATTFAPEAAESILDSVEGMNSALEEIGAVCGQIDEMNVVVESLQTALNAISEFGVAEESIGSLDPDGQLQACINMQMPALEALESMSEAALEDLDKKWETAIEGKIGDAMTKVKEFFKHLWDKIVEYAKKFWSWLKGLFGKNKAETPKAEAAAKATAAAGVEQQANAVVAASTQEETVKAQTALKDAVQAAPEAKKEAAANEIAKVEVTQAPPPPNTAPCNYKDAMRTCKDYSNAMKTYRDILTRAATLSKKNWLQIENAWRSDGATGNIGKMSEQAFNAMAEMIRDFAASCEPLKGIGISVKTNWNVDDPGRLKLIIEPLEQKGSNSQLGWNSRKQVQEFIQTWNSINPDVVSESVIARVADDMKKTGDAGTGFAASAEVNDAFRKLMYTAANFAAAIQRLSQMITARMQAQFNWCKAKNALIISAEKSALNA